MTGIENIGRSTRPGGPDEGLDSLNSFNPLKRGGPDKGLNSLKSGGSDRTDASDTTRLPVQSAERFALPVINFPSTVRGHLLSIVRQTQEPAVPASEPAVPAAAKKKKHFRPKKMWKKFKERFAKKPKSALLAQATVQHPSALRQPEVHTQIPDRSMSTSATSGDRGASTRNLATAQALRSTFTPYNSPTRALASGIAPSNPQSKNINEFDATEAQSAPSKISSIATYATDFSGAVNPDATPLITRDTSNAHSNDEVVINPEDIQPGAYAINSDNIGTPRTAPSRGQEDTNDERKPPARPRQD